MPDTKLSRLASQLKPYLGTSGVSTHGGGTTQIAVHAFDSDRHTGLLPWSLLNKAGSNINELGGTLPPERIQVDEIEIVDLKASGLTVGEVLAADGPSTFSWRPLLIGEVSATGSQYDIVNIDGSGNLATVAPASDASAGNLHLISDSQGDVTVHDVNATNDIIAPELHYNGSRGAFFLGMGSPLETGATTALYVKAFQDDDTTIRIRVRENQTGRAFRIEDYTGSELIRVLPNGDMESGTFDDTLGWKLAAGGDFWALDGFLRGELSSAMFTADEINAVQGSIWLADGQASLETEAVIGAEGSTVVFRVKDPESGAFPIAQAGEILHVRTMGVQPTTGSALSVYAWDVNSTGTSRVTIQAIGWYTVDSVARVNDRYEYTCTVEPESTRCSLRPGTVLVNLGEYEAPGGGGDEGRLPGHIFMTSRPGFFGPSLSIRLLDSNTPWSSGFKKTVVVGHLANIQTSYAPTGYANPQVYGVAVSQDFKDPLAPHVVFSDQYFGLNQVDLNFTITRGQEKYRTGLISADGSLTFGYDIINDASTGSLHYDSWSGDFRVGWEHGQHFKWNQNIGVMEITAGPLRTGDTTPDIDYDALILSATDFGHYAGTRGVWKSRFDSSGSFQMIATPIDEEDEPDPGAGLFWDSRTGTLSGRSGSATQWSASAYTGILSAGGGGVTLSSSGLGLRNTDENNDPHWQGEERVTFSYGNDERASMGNRVYGTGENDNQLVLTSQGDGSSWGTIALRSYVGGSSGFDSGTGGDGILFVMPGSVYPAQCGLQVDGSSILSGLGASVPIGTLRIVGSNGYYVDLTCNTSGQLVQTTGNY